MTDHSTVLEATGDDAVEVMAKSDGPAWKVIANDGVDDEFRTSIARAVDDDAIDPIG
ncbi:hypothetical protein [Halorhabdus sp. BNX81]|uniref:hypothetical protein n=1 Tax=Halorhabdus sp. BNX81 TaxID=2980181 RepID=UPI0023DD5E2F|nr:hypothetical protein [Halorhabdus sp. BNX81]WEL20120.1 hypothetical protein HBNXHr_0041 [Halorhabdus sp. BNX81]